MLQYEVSFTSECYRQLILQHFTGISNHLLVFPLAADWIKHSIVFVLF